MSNCTYKVKIKDIQNNYKVIMEDIQNKYKFKIFCTGNSYDDTEIREEIEALQDELDEAEEELEQYKTIYNALPKVTGEGSNITLNNTANSVMKFKEYKGDTYQETTTGKNLLYLASKYDYGQNGVNGAYNETDGSFTITGKATSSTNSQLTRTIPLELTAGTYTFSLDHSISKQIYLHFNLVGSGGTTQNLVIPDGQTEVTDTLTADTTGYNIRFSTTNGNTYNEKVYMQLESGSTATSFEKFTFGASPNPSYPQNISVVTGTQNVEVCGKNLFDKNNMALNEYIRDDGTTLLSDYWDITHYIRIIPNETFTYNGLTTVGTSVVQSAYYDKNKNFISVFKQATGTNTITPPANAYYVRFSINKGSNDKDTFMLEKGSTSSTYEEYIGTTYPVNLGNIELCKISTYQDRIYKQNDKWYLEKKTGKVTLNGSEHWTQAQYGYFADTNMFPNRDLLAYKGYCNYFIVNDNSTTWTNLYYCGWSAIGLFWIRDDYTLASTQVEFKQWVSAHNLHIYYVLETPTTTEITDTTLIGQLEAISKQLAYKGQTNIMVSGNLPVIINVETLKDLSVEETPVASVTRLQSIRPTIIQTEINNIEEQPEEIEEEIPEQE